MMATQVDISEFDEGLDERDWQLFSQYDEKLAQRLEIVVRRGATEEQIKRAIRSRPGDDRLLARVPGAARHLRRQVEQGAM
jgi:hypothetical protein